MTINCESMEKFVEVIAGLVKQGLMFKAYSADLSITLTGGY